MTTPQFVIDLGVGEEIHFWMEFKATEWNRLAVASHLYWTGVAFPFNSKSLVARPWEPLARAIIPPGSSGDIETGPIKPSEQALHQATRVVEAIEYQPVVEILSQTIARERELTGKDPFMELTQNQGRHSETVYRQITQATVGKPDLAALRARVCYGATDMLMIASGKMAALCRSPRGSELLPLFRLTDPMLASTLETMLNPKIRLAWAGRYWALHKKLYTFDSEN